MWQERSNHLPITVIIILTTVCYFKRFSDFSFIPSLYFIESNVSSKCHLWHRNCAFGSITQEIVMLVVIIIFKMLKLFSLLLSIFEIYLRSRSFTLASTRHSMRECYLFFPLRRKIPITLSHHLHWRESGQKQRILNSFVLNFQLFFSSSTKVSECTQE